MPDLTLLTMTGERPEAWELCKRWMRNQSFQGSVRWIVVDDARKSGDYAGMPDHWENFIIRRQPYWEPGQNTQALNILAGLEHVEPGDRLVIIEDDDWVSPTYLGSVNAWINEADLVGESHTLYCNVATGVVKRCQNHAHASLCATAMKGPAIDLFRQVAASGSKFIDVKLWSQLQGTKRLWSSDQVIGIKGLPGRAGIGIGHRMEGQADFQLMQAMIGADFEHYEKFSGVPA